MKIRAAVVKEQSGPFLLEELETDTLRDDEILVRIAGAGICHTDLICRDQVYPVLPLKRYDIIASYLNQYHRSRTP
jgi:aryl-alcohol dehydrogenase